MGEDEGYKDFLRKVPGRKTGKEYKDFLNREGDEKKEREVVLEPGVIKPRHLSERAGHAEWDNVDNKPSTFPPSSHVHDQYLKGDYDSDYKLIVVEK